MAFHREPSKYEMTEMVGGVAKDNQTPEPSLNTAPAEPVVTDVKIIPTESKNQPASPKTPAPPLTCTAQTLKFLGWHHPQVSIPKKIVQTMLSILYGINATRLVVSSLSWVAEGIITANQSSDPEGELAISQYPIKTIGIITGLITWIYLQRTIGENLQNTVNNNIHIQHLEKELEEYNKIIKIISTARDFVMRHHPDVNEVNDHIVNVDAKKTVLTARLSQSRSNVKKNEAKQNDNQKYRSKWDRVKSYLNPAYFYPSVTVPQIVQQTLFSAIPSITLTRNCADGLGYLIGNESIGLIISAAFIPIPSFFVTQKTLGKNFRDNNLYKDHLSHASSLVVTQKQLVENTVILAHKVLTTLQEKSTDAKQVTAALPTKKSSVEIMADLKAIDEEIKKHQITASSPNKYSDCMQKVLEQVFYSYPHIPWKKDALKTIFAAGAGYDFYSSILAIASVTGNASIALKVFSGILAAAGGYSAQTSVGTGVTNSASHKDFVDDFKNHIQDQLLRFKTLVPALRSIIERTEVPFGEENNIKRNLLEKDLKIVEDHILKVENKQKAKVQVVEESAAKPFKLNL